MSGSPRRANRGYASAEDFYKTKLATNPEMPRYNHLMAAICSAKGETDQANGYYRTSIMAQPGNMMTRNDYAVHLARSDRKDDAIHELKKALLISEKNAVVQKNLAATLGNVGQFSKALEAATTAGHLNPYDAMNHRNLARIHAALGDARSSLEHNLASIRLDNPHAQSKPVTTAFRSAAVQIIAKGGRRDDAYALMDQARMLEKKHIDLPTSTQTYEIIQKIKRRHGHSLAEIEKEKQAEAQKQLIYDYDNKDNVLSEIRKMKLTKSIKT